jgi:hypothetical protein
MNAQTKIEADTLHSAMALAFAEIESATKSATGQVGQQKYKYADLTGVIEAIKPALIKHNLFFTQHPAPHDKGVQIETILHHAGGESVSLGTLFVPASKQDAQGFGSAMTYARRYALQTAFGVPVEDDDGNAAVKATENASKAQFISNSDLELVMKLCEAVGDNQPAAIMKGYAVKRLSELPAEKAAAVIARLNEKLADKAKAETNAKAETPFGELVDDEIPY